ncbi:hypothetical protein EDB19DRAFT_1245516 [Suillus lakei]|nr:hypothetical protein EDB19DRAFT_1245516 [Suillus lakei]
MQILHSLISCTTSTQHCFFVSQSAAPYVSCDKQQHQCESGNTHPCVATCTLLTGWDVQVGSHAYITTVLILQDAKDIVFSAAVTVLLAVHIATRLSPCSDRHYRCCQHNNNGEEGDTHCLFEEGDGSLLYYSERIWQNGSAWRMMLHDEKSGRTYPFRSFRGRSHNFEEGCH